MRSMIMRLLSGSMLFTGFYAKSFSQSLQEVIISQNQFQIPVLIQKKDNPVLRIKITVLSNSSPKELTSMDFSTSGTSSLQDIRQAQLYYGGSDSSAGRFGNLEKAWLFGKASRLTEKISIKGNQLLPAGDHYFWLSYELNERADMIHFVDANCLTVAFAKQIIKLQPEADKVPQRIGFALRKHMQDSVHTYRIPGITTTKKGTLLAVYDARRESSRLAR